MRSTLRSILAAITLTAVLGLATACSLAIPSDSDQTRLEALDKYIELERATLPEIDELYPGVYEDISFDGAIKTLGASDGVATGRYAVITYHYVFAAENDWEASTTQFETQRAMFNDLCEKTVFKAMALYGVTGLKGATWSYTDIANTSKIMWSHSCYGE
jgi:hypothetical protein